MTFLDADDFRGRGWATPLAFTADGEAEMAAGDTDIEQAVRSILRCSHGERAMRPDFGSGLDALAFEPLSAATVALVRHRVEQSLVAWEPRIDVTEVKVEAARRELGRLDIDVRYRVRATNVFYNLVYPFYLQEGRPT